MSEDSYSNVKSNWYPELRNFEPDTPIVLVGTKKDLRDDENSKENFKISTVKGTSNVTRHSIIVEILKICKN